MPCSQKLTIRNFGPIREVEIEMNDLMVIIGPQSGGKSTIVKNIYFFTSLKDYLLEFIYDVLAGPKLLPDHTPELMTGVFKFKLSEKFQLFWSKGVVNPDAMITYNYGDDRYLSIQAADGKFDVYTPDAVTNFLLKIVSDMIDLKVQISGKDNIPQVVREVDDPSYIRNTFLTAKDAEIAAFFGLDNKPYYTPAGRGVLSTLSEPLINQIMKNVADQVFSEDKFIHDPTMMDYPLRVYINRITSMKSQFAKSLADLVKDHERFSGKKIDHSAVDRVIEMIPAILKGRYSYENGSEKIYLPGSDTSVDLRFASAGQQESVWILLQIFQLVLHRLSALMIIEEPEAHLYPETQKELVALLSFFANLNGNRVIITTHSPYLLTAISNLMFAGSVGADKQKEVAAVIPKDLWLNRNRVSAWMLADGVLEDIVDEELGQIKVEKIDSASAEINSEYDKLLDIKYA